MNSDKSKTKWFRFLEVILIVPAFILAFFTLSFMGSNNTILLLTVLFSAVIFFYLIMHSILVYILTEQPKYLNKEKNDVTEILSTSSGVLSIKDRILGIIGGFLIAFILPLFFFSTVIYQLALGPISLLFGAIIMFVMLPNIVLSIMRSRNRLYLVIGILLGLIAVIYYFNNNIRGMGF